MYELLNCNGSLAGIFTAKCSVNSDELMYFSPSMYIQSSSAI